MKTDSQNVVFFDGPIRSGEVQELAFSDFAFCRDAVAGETAYRVLKSRTGAKPAITLTRAEAEVWAREQASRLEKRAGAWAAVVS